MNNALTLNQLQAVKAAYAKHRFRSISTRAKFALALEGLVDHHDIQSVRNKRTGNVVMYANLGDTYNTTILCYVSDACPKMTHPANWKYKIQFRLGSWGDLVESGLYE
jgi:hypothetical protein